MTNIQAIDLLKDLEQSLDDYCELNDEGKTAFRMAITALELFGISEQLPPAQSEERTEKRTKTHACDLIRRKTGVWLAYTSVPGYMFCKCAACGADILVPYTGRNKPIFNYCPNCGAKMGEKQYE